MTNRIMKSGNFVKVVESGASAKKGEKGGHQFFSNEEGIKNLVQMQEDKGGHLCMSYRLFKRNKCKGEQGWGQKNAVLRW